VATLWRFWPVVLILAGLEILIRGSRSTIVYAIGLLIALLILGGAIGYSIYQSGQSTSRQPAVSIDTIREERRDADGGDIGLILGVGQLVVGALSDSPSFAEGKINYGRYSTKAEQSFRLSNGIAVFSVQTQNPSLSGSMPADAVADRWDIKFTPSIPLDLSVAAGIGKVDMDLMDLRVARVHLQTGVGSAAVAFPAEAGRTSASVEIGVGSIVVRIPSGVGARIHVSRFLAPVEIRNGRLARSDDVYVTADYQTAQHTLDLEIKTAMGRITIW
jgi:hypothetical protein